MRNYSDFPPCPYFLSVLKHAPESAYLYYLLWHHSDDDCKLSYLKTQIKNSFLISTTLFKNRLFSLVDLGLISVNESPNYIDIELVNWDEDFFEANGL
jgi:retron-type reverse transcriptase